MLTRPGKIQKSDSTNLFRNTMLFILKQSRCALYNIKQIDVADATNAKRIACFTFMSFMFEVC